MVTEHDVRPGAWYLDAGRIPACVAIEAGQADLFLSGYLGIDFRTRGRAVYRLLDWRPGQVSDEEIVERCWLQMLNETARCMEDGIIQDPADVDIGVIFGFGFPPFRGGLLQEADRQGLDRVVSRLEGYAARHGRRFEPAELLREMARKGERFYPV